MTGSENSHFVVIQSFQFENVYVVDRRGILKKAKMVFADNDVFGI